MFFAFFQGIFLLKFNQIKNSEQRKNTTCRLDKCNGYCFENKKTAKKYQSFIHVLLWHNLGCLAVEVSFIIGVVLFANTLCQ